MLRRFEVSNYRNFRDSLVIDFSSVGGYQFNQECIADDMIAKMLIYGRNATGKTNLGRAITDINLYGPQQYRFVEQGNYLNADSELEAAKFDYLFQFGDIRIQYVYEKFSMFQYKSEFLSINGEIVYSFDYKKREFDSSNLKLISAETINVELFLNGIAEGNNDDLEMVRPSFLRWLFANAVFASDSPMVQLRGYIERMAATSISALMRVTRIGKDAFIETLEGDNLKQLETFLNDMGVKCKLVSKKLPDGQNELYFKHKKLVPFFETASSGTMVLFNIYRRFVTKFKNCSYIYIDEFDAFFHYEMAEKFLVYLKTNFPNSQITLTSHNTNLMTNRLMRPDCLFILSQSGKLVPLNKATTRELREGHNLEKLYMSGEFDEYCQE